MTGNFTVSDLVAIGEGFGLFGLFLFVPGYVLGWLLDVLQFRRASLLRRVALSTPLSIAFCPMLTFLLARFLPFTAVWVAYGVLWAAFLVLVLPVRGRILGEFPRGMLVFFAVAAGWLVVGAFSLVDLQIGDRLYSSATTSDYCIRTAFTHSISTTGIPPQNPLFLPGHPVGLRYHYFWLILCSLVDQLGGAAVGPRHAMIAGTLWCGLGLMVLIPLYLRFFDCGGATGLRRRSLAGIALLGVTGLDIIPTVLSVMLYSKGVFGFLAPSVEWWNNQIDGWGFTMLWEPHYLAGLIASLVGFLILWHAPEAPRRRDLLLAGVAAGAALATTVGASVYVALVFAVFLALWTLVTLVKKWYRETAVLAIAGVTTLLLSIPYLRTLSGPAAGGSFLRFTVRSFFPAEILVKGLGFDRWWALAIANGLFLPLNYFLELGFFFAIGYLQWRKYRQRGTLTRQETAALLMVSTSVVVCTFVRSGLIVNNDLGWRGFLIAQFMLLIWGANYLAERAGRGVSRRQRIFLTALLTLGAAGTVYDVVMQRVYVMLADAGKVTRIWWLPSERGIGKRAYANRVAYEWLQRQTPELAIVQQNPDVPIQDTFFLLYGNRPTVAVDLACGAGFGGDPRMCDPILTPLKDLFSTGAGAGKAEAVCGSLPISALVVHDTDQVWNDRHSWVWTRKATFANDFVRVVPCSRP